MFALLSTPRAGDGHDLVPSCKADDYDDAGNAAIDSLLNTGELDSPSSAASSSSSAGGSFRNRKPQSLSIDCGNRDSTNGSNNTGMVCEILTMLLFTRT